MSQERLPLLGSANHQDHASFSDHSSPMLISRRHPIVQDSDATTAVVSLPSENEGHHPAGHSSPLDSAYGSPTKDDTRSHSVSSKPSRKDSPVDNKPTHGRTAPQNTKEHGGSSLFHKIKTIILTVVVFAALVVLALSPETNFELPSVAVSSKDPFVIEVSNDPIPPLLRVMAHPSFSTFDSGSPSSAKVNLAKRSLFSSKSDRAARLARANKNARTRLLSYRQLEDSSSTKTLKINQEPSNYTFFVISIQRSEDNVLWTTIPDGEWELLIEPLAEDDSHSDPKSVQSERSIEFESDVEDKTFVRTWKISSEFDSGFFRVLVETNSELPVVLPIKTLEMPAIAEYEVLLSAIILIFVYSLIVFELVHRVVAAMLGSLVTLAVLSICQSRPNLEIVISWIDFETCALLFGMMILVGIFTATGFFEYAAVQAYKLSKGRTWRLISILCILTGVLSSFLDNVTTILLITPVTIRLCQVIDLDPKPILLAEILFSNVCGAATAVGDPPNVIIVSNAAIAAAGIDFANYTLHLSVGVIFVSIVGYFALWWTFRNTNFVQDAVIAELEREIWIWKKASQGLNSSVAEEKEVGTMLRQKIRDVEDDLRERRRALYDGTRTSRNQQQSMEEGQLGSLQSDTVTLHGLESEYRITNVPLFIKSVSVLSVTIVLFFLHSFIPALHLNLGWIAIAGAVFLLVLADIEDLESIIARVEWATLLFFATLFVLMEGITNLGLLAFIGDALSSMIASIGPDARLTVAIILIVWTGAIVSAFIDNIPLTTAMIPVILQLSESPSVNLPLKPLVWALAFGNCLGGNGTLIASSANVVCAGIAGSYGYPITFNYFFKIGAPFTIITVVAATIYLLICHPLGGWND